MTNDSLKFGYRKFEGLHVPTVEFENAESAPLCVTVFGEIQSWSPRKSHEARMRLHEWRVIIARRVKVQLGDIPRPSSHFAISIGLVFNRNNNHQIDVDNRIKPIVDATATALFETDFGEFLHPIEDAIQTYRQTHVWSSKDLPRWGRDDHKFKTVFAHRLPNASGMRLDAEPRWSKEGIAICISSLDHSELIPEAPRLMRTGRRGPARRNSVISPNQYKLNLWP